MILNQESQRSEPITIGKEFSFYKYIPKNGWKESQSSEPITIGKEFSFFKYIPKNGWKDCGQNTYGRSFLNCGVELTEENLRLGRKCKIPMLRPNGRSAIHTRRERSFQINGPRHFKNIPKSIRSITVYQDDFQKALDMYLSDIPEQPKIGTFGPEAIDQLTGRQSNSLLVWTTTL